MTTSTKPKTKAATKPKVTIPPAVLRRLDMLEKHNSLLTASVISLERTVDQQKDLIVAMSSQVNAAISRVGNVAQVFNRLSLTDANTLKRVARLERTLGKKEVCDDNIN